MIEHMKGKNVTVIGGGPAGLGTAIILAYMGAQVNVHERLQPDQGKGFGLTLHREMADYLLKIDPFVFNQCNKAFCPGYDQYVTLIGNDAIFSNPPDFADGIPGFLTGVKRRVVIDALREGAERYEERITLHYGVPIDEDFVRQAKEESDLVIGADGLHSIVRETFRKRFQPQEIVSETPYLWFELDKSVGIFTRSYAGFEDGVVQVHAWPDSSETSSGYLEISSPDGNPLEDEHGSISASHAEHVSDLFTYALCKEQIKPRGSKWRTFRAIRCNTSYFDNVVLLGDAYGTVHFHTGAGMLLAFFCAKTLAEQIEKEKGNIPRSIRGYNRIISKNRQNDFANTLKEISKNDNLWSDWKRCGSPEKFFESKFRKRTSFDPTQKSRSYGFTTR